MSATNTKDDMQGMGKIPDIAYYGYVGGFGLSEAGRTNALALQWAGYRVMRAGATEFGIHHSHEAHCPLVIHHWHPNSHRGTLHHLFERHRPPKRVAYWAWECEAGWFKGMIDHAHHFDEIWTPSEYSTQMLRPLGPKVRTVPHAVRKACRPARKRGAIFRVFCPFDAWSRFSRKNPDGAIKAFKEAFPESKFPNCELVLKTHHLAEEERSHLLETAADDRIVLCEGFLKEMEIQKMFLDSDCVISLHRSEGFGLNLARAICYGIPLVATNYGGCAEWLDDCYRVDWKPHRIAVKDYYPVGAFWAEPDIDHAAELLREVYDNPEAARRKAEHAQEHTDFSIDTLAQRFINIIDELNVLPDREGIATATRHLECGNPITSQ